MKYRTHRDEQTLVNFPLGWYPKGLHCINKDEIEIDQLTQ